MKQTAVKIVLFSLGILALVLVASSAPARSARNFSVSSDPKVVVLTIQIKDIVAPGLEQFELLGDGWFQRRGSQTEAQRAATSTGISVDREELLEALSDLVEYDVVDADFARLHEALEPSYGVLPDGRRFHAGSSEPGTGCLVTVNFESVNVGGKRVESRDVSFTLEPYTSYRYRRPDISALEGIARFGEKLGGWLQRLRSAEKPA